MSSLDLLPGDLISVGHTDPLDVPGARRRSRPGDGTSPQERLAALTRQPMPSTFSARMERVRAISLLRAEIKKQQAGPPPPEPGTVPCDMLLLVSVIVHVRTPAYPTARAHLTAPADRTATAW